MDLLELHGVKERLLEDALSGGGQSEIAAKLTVDDLKRLFNPCRSSLRKDNRERLAPLAQPESAVQDGEGQMSKTQPLWQHGTLPETCWAMGTSLSETSRTASCWQPAMPLKQCGWRGANLASEAKVDPSMEEKAVRRWFRR